MEQQLTDIQNQIGRLESEYRQHHHTGVDTPQVIQNDLGGFISQIDVYKTALQTITNNTETLVEFDTENFDNGQEFDVTTHLFTAKTSGLYLILSGLNYATSSSTTADKTLGLRLKKNGTIYSESYVASPNDIVIPPPVSITVTATNPKVSVMTQQIIHLDKGDTIGIYAFQNTGASKDIMAGREDNYLSIKKLLKV